VADEGVEVAVALFEVDGSGDAEGDFVEKLVFEGHATGFADAVFIRLDADDLASIGLVEVEGAGAVGGGDFQDTVPLIQLEGFAQGGYEGQAAITVGVAEKGLEEVALGGVAATGG
jgi:hypothetical protein